MVGMGFSRRHYGSGISVELDVALRWNIDVLQRMTRTCLSCVNWCILFK